MEVPQQIKIKTTPGNRKQKGKRSAPKGEDRMTGKKEPYAYTFKDKSLGELPILNSANAWWLDMAKVYALVNAYKVYATDQQACYYAGISMTQLQYFQDLHPDFYIIKHTAKQDPNLRAKQTIIKHLDKDPAVAKWWLEVTEPNTFKKKEAEGESARDLFDKMTVELKQFTESVRFIEKDGEYKEHISESSIGDDDARPGGDGDETTPAEDAVDPSEAPA
jgi:hypothetical protein